MLIQRLNMDNSWYLGFDCWFKHCYSINQNILEENKTQF